MPDPSHQPVVPLGEGLFDPLHNRRKFHPVFRLYVEAEPIILQAQGAQGEYEPKLRLLKHLVKELQGLGLAEQRLPIVELGADLIPRPLF
jgi:hypothetical protein